MLIASPCHGDERAIQVGSEIHKSNHLSLHAQFPMSDDFDLTPSAVHAIRVSQYFTLASSTLYLYDLLLTIDLEIDLLWPSKWTLMKVIYLLQRYLPVVDMVIVSLIWQFGKVSNLRTCEILFQGFDWSCLVGITFSEVWGNTTRIRIALFLFSLGCTGPLYWILANETFIYHSIPIPGMYCLAAAGPGIRYLCWTLLTVYDTGLLSLMVIQAFRAYEPGWRCSVNQPTLSHIVYQDGVLYYLYLVALSTLNVIVTLKLPGSSADLLITSIQRVLYSVLTTRVVLHIREQTHRTQVVTTL
ncbi:hypothetical protein BDN72DRAFT_328595 [Pluteus cervinus]|uniref:Uncharacterized protein n=1 Tax=Pluteus cervinus TaxID=181527 RepID=A0ACD3ABS0_9AGAR|nr:hypothetical protein BDN72DRAFT_328595 [Pluteus cervinus]